MRDKEVFTIRSLKKGAIICLQITILFGVIFSVIYQQTTIEGIASSFLISGMFSFGLGFGNGFLNNYLTSKSSFKSLKKFTFWKAEPKRIAAFFSSLYIVSLPSTNTFKHINPTTSAEP